jgi:hypothetical protein
MASSFADLIGTPGLAKLPFCADVDNQWRCRAVPGVGISAYMVKPVRRADLLNPYKGAGDRAADEMPDALAADLTTDR